MIINRPLRKDYIRTLAFDQTAELVVMFVVNNGLRVELPGEDWTCLENFACFDSLGSARCGGAGERRFVGAFAFIEVKQDDVVAKVRVAGGSSAAAVFGVAGVAAGDDDLQLRRFRC